MNKPSSFDECTIVCETGFSILGLVWIFFVEPHSRTETLNLLIMNLIR